MKVCKDNIEPKKLEEIKQKYSEYLENHFRNCRKSFNLFVKLELGEFLELSESEMKKLRDNLEHHDESKIDDDTFLSYAIKFYGSPEEKDDYSNAVFHHLSKIHQMSELHHYEHYVIDGKPIDMDKIAIFEMLCDWMSFSYYNSNANDMFEYWNKKKDSILLSEKTKVIVNNCMDYLYEKMDMIKKDINKVIK